MLKCVLFDLDGTLLPLDQDIFVKVYFRELSTRMARFGIAPDALVKAVWTATGAMMQNDGNALNIELFWKSMRNSLGDGIIELRPEFDKFYFEEFENVRSVCGCDPRAREIIDMLKNSGITAACVTLPVFPADGTIARIRWAGLDKSDFALITTYENCRFTKPDLKYYQEIFTQLGYEPSEYLMVGNNVDEDMKARDAGADVFLLTDCIINEHNKDISVYPHGGFDELKEYLAERI